MGASVTTTKHAVWTCPKCQRQFRKTKQVHSCSYYPLQKHLAGKSEAAVALYATLIARLHRSLGSFYIESLPCCIHLVNNAYTFAAVYVMHDKVRLHLASPTPVSNPRINRIFKASNRRWVYSLDVNSPTQINTELISWIRQSYLAGQA